MKIKNLATILLVCLLIMPVVAAAARQDTLRVGKDHFYFNGVKSTSIHGLETAIKDYKNTSITVLLCTNGDAKKLKDVMAFLDEHGISNVTIKSPQQVTNC